MKPRVIVAWKPPPTAQLGQNQTAVLAIELYMYVGSIEVVVKIRQNYVRAERSKLDLSNYPKKHRQEL